MFCQRVFAFFSFDLFSGNSWQHEAEGMFVEIMFFSIKWGISRIKVVFRNLFIIELISM